MTQSGRYIMAGCSGHAARSAVRGTTNVGSPRISAWASPAAARSLPTATTRAG